MSHFVISSVDADASSIEYEYSYSKDLRRFFTGDEFFVEYDAAANGSRPPNASDVGTTDASDVVGTMDVSDVPESILTIPLLANVAPIAWANDADVYVNAIDREFADSLRAVRRSLADMYPDLIRGGGPGSGDARGTIRANEVIDNRQCEGAFDGTGLLFSGGVDSLTSYLRHRGEDPTLIGVHGADIDVDQETAWERTRREIAAFGEERDAEVRFVTANMREFVDKRMLLAHYGRYLSDNWFSCVQHGLGLLGLCAPLSDAERIGQLYIAATHSEEFAQPWGSHPDIDDHVSWGKTSARHDGYDLTRQEKLAYIADYVREDGDELYIRSCFESEVGGNCNRCEKCARTQVGLLLAGLDPNDHGYAVDGETFERIRRKFENGEWVLGPDEQFMWTDIQNHVPADPDLPYPEAEAFCEWLVETDVEEIVDRSGQPAHYRLIRLAARNTPYPAYAALLPLYEGARRLLDPEEDDPDLDPARLREIVP